MTIQFTFVQIEKAKNHLADGYVLCARFDLVAGDAGHQGRTSITLNSDVIVFGKSLEFKIQLIGRDKAKEKMIAAAFDIVARGDAALNDIPDQQSISAQSFLSPLIRRLQADVAREAGLRL